jgi:hypothetical protein
MSEAKNSKGRLTVLVKWCSDGETLPEGWSTPGSYVEKRNAEIERLQHDVTRYMAIAAEHATDNERLRAALERIADMEYGLTHAMDFVSCRSIAVQALSPAPADARSVTSTLSNERVSTATAGAVSETDTKP